MDMETMREEEVTEGAGVEVLEPEVDSGEVGGTVVVEVVTRMAEEPMEEAMVVVDTEVEEEEWEEVLAVVVVASEDKDPEETSEAVEVDTKASDLPTNSSINSSEANW